MGLGQSADVAGEAFDSGSTNADRREGKESAAFRGRRFIAPYFVSARMVGKAG